MKLIIIIQTLIIVAGGYYVYLITREPATVTLPDVSPTIQMNIATGTPREGYAPPTSNPPIDPLSASSSVTGPSDVGMEFPTPDEDLQVQ